MHVQQVVPKLVKEKYIEELQNARKLDVCGQRFKIFYNANEGLVFNLGQVMELFKLRRNELIIFKFGDRNIIFGRVYQQDGMEIDYYKRTMNISVNPLSECFWQLDLTFDSGMTLNCFILSIQL